MTHHHFFVDVDVAITLRIADRPRYQGEIECISDIYRNVYLHVSMSSFLLSILCFLISFFRTIFVIMLYKTENVVSCHDLIY